MLRVIETAIQLRCRHVPLPLRSNQLRLGCELQDLRSYGASGKKRLLPALLSHFDLTACYMSSTLR